MNIDSERERAAGPMKWFRQASGATDDAPGSCGGGSKLTRSDVYGHVPATMPYRLARLQTDHKLGRAFSLSGAIC